MKISEVAQNMGRINIEAAVIEVSQAKEFSKFGKIGRVASAVIKDDSGEIKLTLWDEQIDLIKPGDKIRIANGYAKEWQGELQLNIGRYGSLEIIK